MPQSSLTTWLKKPNSVSEQKCSAQNVEQQETSDVLTTSEPARSGEEENSASSEPKRSNSKGRLFGSTEKLIPNVELRSCTKDDIPRLKHLMSLLLPIPYPERFYKEIVEDEVVNSITLLAIWHDDPVSKRRGQLVGAIRCRLLNNPFGSAKHEESPMLYLSTLALLSPFRSHGIATHMLSEITRYAIEEHEISTIGAHVWEANADGLLWYQKRGFHEVRREESYYRRLDPQGAVVLQRDIGVKDLLGK